jgi:hypothetical protein
MARTTANRPRRGSRYGWLVIGAAALGWLPWLVLSAWLGGLSGDLTRIGAWPERDYNRRAAQPSIAVPSNQLQPEQIQVLVLGDSFSMGNVWQAVLGQGTGLASKTWGYGGHGCVEAFLDLIEQPAYGHVQEVVIQTVERHLLDRFEQPAACAHPGLVAFEGLPGVTEPRPPKGQFIWDWRHLLQTLANMQRRRQSDAGPIASRDTLNVGLDSPTLFSNRQSQRLLYYLGDEAKAHWTPERVNRAILALQHIQQRVAGGGRRFTFLVVPDKSSVYRPHVPLGMGPHGQPQFHQAFIDGGIHLVWPLRELQTHSGVDVYLPNDTHLSPLGFSVVGASLLHAWRMPGPSTPAMARP